MDKACAACHQGEADLLSDPDHASPALAGVCDACHVTDAWLPAEFDHGLSDYPLTGAHLETDCNACHGLEAQPRFTGLDDRCTACHQGAADELPDPDHDSPALGTDCALCHSTLAWLPADFDHNRSSFALTGAHVATDCAACHGEGDQALFSGLDPACFACHQQDYEQADNPDHTNPALPTDCQVCHSTQAWQPAEFDHQLTDFPLTGAHTEVDCAGCHIGGVYTGLDPACVACHLDDYNDADDPDHAGENLPLDCALCHNTSDWEDADFNHNETRFPLLGAHQPLACVACHAEGYADTPFACQACHLDDWQGAALPHEEQSFTLDCTRCHNQDGWSPSSFSHDGMTEWPLTGAHGAVSCTACHTGGTYAQTPALCRDCHQADWDQAQPPHEEDSFQLDCQRCHATTAWSPSSFDHTGMTDYPLTGQHVTASCVACHSGGQYANTPDECLFCHQTDFNSANDPDHPGEGYPDDCRMCHTTQGWDSDFNHGTQYFPIYNGEHRNEWDTCTDCHLQGGTMSTFSCTHCHEHRQSEMDDEHEDENGYVWESSACLQCHPDGSEDHLPGLRMRTPGTNLPDRRGPVIRIPSPTLLRVLLLLIALVRLPGRSSCGPP